MAVNPSVGSYGVFENGTFSESVAVKKEHRCLIPEEIGDVAAGLPVAYLTALIVTALRTGKKKESRHEADADDPGCRAR